MGPLIFEIVCQLILIMDALSVVLTVSVWWMVFLENVIQNKDELLMLIKH